jgi:hypothetical protein
VSESAVSAKRDWVSFGAKTAQSETPARATAKRRAPGRGRSGKKMRSYPFIWSFRESGRSVGNDIPVVGLVEVTDICQTDTSCRKCLEWIVSPQVLIVMNPKHE